MRPTTEQSAAIEYDVLTTEWGRRLLDEIGSTQTITPVKIARWRKCASAEQVSAAIRLAQGRIRGAAKYTCAADMWFDPTGLEQATAEIVATHKAKRFADSDVIDLCCGIGGDSIALARRASRVVAVDRDFGMLRRCRWNVAAYGHAERLVAVRADAERFAITPHTMVHVDPDRRAGPRGRAKTIAEYVPSSGFLRTLPDRCRGGAIKLSPASGFESVFPNREHEVELISLDGECKEATIWFGAAVTCGRRATQLPSGLTWTDLDGAAGVMPIQASGDVLLESDPALSRSGLLEGFGLAHGLGRKFSGIDLLSGTFVDSSPWLKPFTIVSEMAMDSKVIRREVRRLGLRIVEVKTRRMPEVVPSSWLTEEPGVSATLFLVRTDDGGRALLTRRARSVSD